MAFWERYPSPSCLDGVSIKKLTTFLLEASNNTCSVKKASEIMKLVKEDGHTTKEHQETRDFLVRSIVRDISFKKQEMSYVERELKELMSLLDFQLVSMPGIDLVTASALIAEIGDVRRFSNANKLAKVSSKAVYSNVVSNAKKLGGQHVDQLKYALSHPVVAAVTSKTGQKTIRGSAKFIDNALRPVEVRTTQTTAGNKVFAGIGRGESTGKLTEKADSYIAIKQAEKDALKGTGNKISQASDDITAAIWLKMER